MERKICNLAIAHYFWDSLYIFCDRLISTHAMTMAVNIISEDIDRRSRFVEYYFATPLMEKRTCFWVVLYRVSHIRITQNKKMNNIKTFWKQVQFTPLRIWKIKSHLGELFFWINYGVYRKSEAYILFFMSHGELCWGAPFERCVIMRQQWI